MDKLTSLPLSFDRILITYVIPGFCAIFPWILYALHFHTETKAFLMQNNSISISIVASLSLITGLVIENLGSEIEVHWYDWMNKKKDAQFPEYWEKYLQLSYKEEPVGQRYLRNILLRMKFELSMGIACISFAAGLALLESVKPSLFHEWWTKSGSYGIPLLLALYFLALEGRKSSQVLAKTRKCLVDKYYTNAAAPIPAAPDAPLQ